MRVYQKIGDQYVYSDQVYVKHSDLKNQKALSEATSAITDITLYDTVNKLNFTFTNTYTGTESVSYGVLFYRDGELTNDMQVDDAGISNSPLTSGSGSFQIKDKGNGVYVRVYQKIGDQYVYSDQVYVKHSGL